VVVSRPTRWGNPFPVGATVVVDGREVEVPDRATSVDLYRLWLDGEVDLRDADSAGPGCSTSCRGCGAGCCSAGATSTGRATPTC
jgi:hypothetical protein